jgi:non-ribosomal peptide synthetase component F
MSEFGLSCRDRVLQRAPISFDASVGEIFATLVTGAQLVIGKPDGTQDLDYLVHLMAEEKITLADLPPSLLTAMLGHPELTNCAQLKWIFCGGEVLSGELQQKFHETLPAEMYNLYGPTETTIQSTFHKCSARGSVRTVPIGKPIANTQVYVLDREMEPVPAGVDGELYIGGAGLARGYWDRPDLTAEKFVPDPLGPQPGARLYRTGDQVLWTADGNLEFLGRTDHQVKIRGFRIELGEIEAVLGAHAGVQSVLVLAREDQPGDKRLVAYITEHQRANVTTSDLRSYLKKKLPDYMVPSHIVILQQMPLMPNGKVDRRALPAPEPGVTTGHEYTSPRTRTEELLASIWADVLRLRRVGIHDNFFELGGHSLLAMQVVSRIREVFQAELPLSQLFKHATVASLAEKIEEKGANVQLTAIPRAIRKIARRQADTGRCVPQLFEEQAERRPNSVAVACGDRQLTYGQLNSRANQLAHYLKSFGVGPNSLTGICLDRGLELMVALLGILKAGGAYLPMDANSLPERIEHMLEHAPGSVPVLVTQPSLACTVPGYRGQLVCPDSDWPKIAAHSEQNPVPTATLDDRAYVICSSGSNGKAASVVMRHSGLLNRLLSMQEEHGMQSADCVLQQTSLILDAFVWEFFWPLIRGASVVVAQLEGQVETRNLVDRIRSKGVTTVHLVSSQLECFLEEPEVEDCVSLRRVLCSGEALDAEIVGRFHDKLEAELYIL